MITTHVPDDARVPMHVGDVELTGSESFRGLPDVDAHLLLRVRGTPVAVVWRTARRMQEGRAVLAAAMAVDGEGVLRRLLRRALTAGPVSAPLTADGLVANASTGATPGDRGEPSVSVAVCTLGRPSSLERCVRSVREGSDAPLEIVIVENGPPTEASDAIAARAGARLVREPRIGLDWARQRAVVEARGEVIAFTDDDAVPDRHWVGAVRASFAANPEVGVLTGLVLPLELRTEAQLMFEAYGGFARGVDRRWAFAEQRGAFSVAMQWGNIGRLGTGACMAFRRETLERVGPFDPALDVGSPAGGAGDLEMLFRCLRLGETIVYDPRALVRHEHRLTMEELERQIESWGSGFGAFTEAASRRFPESRWQFVLLTLWTAAAWHGRRLLLRRAGERFPTALVRAELRGLRRGSELYQAGAVINGDSVSAERSPGRERPRSARVEERRVDLAEGVRPLTGCEGTLVRVRVTADGREIGRVDAIPLEGAVGADRLADHIADELADRVLERPIRDVAGWTTALADALLGNAVPA